MKQILQVEEAFHQQRIDKYLSDQAADLSRSRIQELIKQGNVLINEKSCKSNSKVKCGDVIEIDVPEEVEIAVEPQNIPIDICYEDSDVIVINKGKGMVVHPSAGHYQDTLVNALLFHCKDLSGINGELRPGIVHRIDKDTTGLIIAAKNDAAHRALAEQLQKKEVNRLYYALVHGVIQHDFGTIDAPIARDPKDRQKMTVAQNGKAARTHFKVLERFRDFTLLECRLETGRTHQIRVHMKYINHPVAGDPKYSYRKVFREYGQYLHAHQLTFVHPRTKETIVVEAQCPQYFEATLHELREEMR